MSELQVSGSVAFLPAAQCGATILLVRRNVCGGGTMAMKEWVGTMHVALVHCVGQVQVAL